MNRHVLLPLLACGLATLPLTGCDMLRKNVKTEVQMPSDRETVVSQTADDTYRSKALERGEIGGYWAIAEVGGKKAKGEEPPFLKFDTGTRRVYGNNGCNILNGTYTADAADSTLTFSDMATTLRMCGTEGLSETDINAALGNTAHYTWSRDNTLYKVTLLSADRQPLMTLIHQDYDFLNGTWTLSSLGGKRVDNPDTKLVIDVEEQKVHGNTGCNILNGALITDMLEAGAITFTNLAITRMMCHDMELETQMLVGLEEVAVARPADADTVNLLDAHGQVIMTLRRVTDNK